MIMRILFFYDNFERMISECIGQGCRFEANCPFVRPGLTGRVPSMGSLIGILARVSEKNTKTPNG